MNRTQTTDLGAQIVEQRDRLTESVGALADRIDTDSLRSHAESVTADLIDTATDQNGRPRRGLLIGLAVTVVALVLVRRVLR
jgi:hypothetical protein